MAITVVVHVVAVAAMVLFMVEIEVSHCSHRGFCGCFICRAFCACAMVLILPRR